MEQPGGAPEPEQSVTQQAPLPPPTPPDDVAIDEGAGPDDAMTGRWFMVAGILVLVAIVGVLAWMARPDDALDTAGRTEERFPPPTTAVPPPTSAPATAPPATTAPAAPVVPVTDAAPVQTPAPTPAPTAAATPEQLPVPSPEPAPAPTLPVTTAAPAPVGPPVVPTTAAGEPDEEPAVVARLVPSLAGLADAPAAAELTARLEELRATARHDIAVPGPVAAICATVALDRPLALGGRWERDGRRIASTDAERRAPPGYGECLTAEGDPLEEGSYQYVAADSEGAESAAGGLVVGAARLEQRFVNNAPSPICAIRIAPSVSRYFEVYVYDAAPITEGSSVVLPVADVEQDVETLRCDGEEVATRFTFEPGAQIQPLDP